MILLTVITFVTDDHDHDDEWGNFLISSQHMKRIDPTGESSSIHHSPADATADVRVGADGRIREDVQDGGRGWLWHLGIGRDQQRIVGLNAVDASHFRVHHSEVQAEEGQHQGDQEKRNDNRLVAVVEAQPTAA